MLPEAIAPPEIAADQIVRAKWTVARSKIWKAIARNAWKAHSERAINEAIKIGRSSRDHRATCHVHRAPAAIVAAADSEAVAAVVDDGKSPLRSIVPSSSNNTALAEELRLFRKSRFDTLFKIYADRDAALAAYTA